MQRCFQSKCYNISVQSNCAEGLHFSAFHYSCKLRRQLPACSTSNMAGHVLDSEMATDILLLSGSYSDTAGEIIAICGSTN